MPEQQEWTQESVEKQITEAEKPAEQAKTETDPEPQAKEKVEERVEKVVPLGALDSERAKRREAQAQAQAVRQQLEQIQREMLELKAAQQPRVQAPDPSVDPAAAILHAQEQTRQKLENLEQRDQRNQQELAQRAQVEGFINEVRTRGAEYAKEHPDVDAAVDFLKKSRADEYKAMGMSAAEAQHRVNKDEWDLAQWAIQNGENPAEVAHNMAKTRGFVSQSKKLEMQKEGQGASMPTSGGGKAGGQPSYDALLKMSPEEFRKATAGDNWQKLMNR